MAAAKQEMVTLKVDRELAQALKMLPNRSEFIRQAMLKALANACPVCQGTGMLSVAQRRHWDRFAKGHPLVHCDECDTYHLDCQRSGEPGDCQQARTGKADKNNTPDVIVDTDRIRAEVSGRLDGAQKSPLGQLRDVGRPGEVGGENQGGSCGKNCGGNCGKDCGEDPPGHPREPARHAR